jgi:hypothetical protein
MASFSLTGKIGAPPRRAAIIEAAHDQGDIDQSDKICAASAPPELTDDADPMSTSALKSALAEFIIISELCAHPLDEQVLDFLNCAATQLPLYVMNSRASCGRMLPVVGDNGFTCLECNNKATYP